MVNHRRNILEFSKSLIVLVQVFHRYTDICPGMGLLDHRSYGQEGLCLPMLETWVRSLGWEDPLEKEMATHSSTLAWEICEQRRGEPGGLQSMGSPELDMTWRLNCHHQLQVRISSHH